MGLTFLVKFQGHNLNLKGLSPDYGIINGVLTDISSEAPIDLEDPALPTFDPEAPAPVHEETEGVEEGTGGAEETKDMAAEADVVIVNAQGGEDSTGLDADNPVIVEDPIGANPTADNPANTEATGSVPS